jgi:hypothetical protein
MRTIPDAARDKLRDLQLARMTAEDAARAITERLNSLPRDADPLLRERLANERDKQNHRQGQLSQLLNRLQQWLGELRANVELKSMPQLELKRGETIEDTRSKIKALREQLAAVKRAPLPQSDQKKLAEDYVVRLARQARPLVGIVNDALRVSFRGDMAAPEDVLALVAWAAPEQLCRALEREIDNQPARADALPASERVRRVAELEDQLHALESREEALIMRAHGDGLEVLRRPDASPPCVLGVVVVTAREAVA